MLVALGIFLLNENKQMCFIMTLVFLVFFELSSGPVVWLYIAEICCDKASSGATVLNQIFNLSSAIVPSLISPDDAPNDEGIAYLFVGFGGLTVLGTVFVMCFMKETKGKSPAEIEQMYSGVKEGYNKTDAEDRFG